MKTKVVLDILNVLNKAYPDAKCGLDYSSPYELLVATILSAQCTDKRVNIVTNKLFKKANTPESIIDLGLESLKIEIKECGLFNNKSKNIISMSKDILEKHNGKVPKSLQELENLSGVGRKTANVVLSNAFGKPAIAVDTHVYRVSNKVGMAKANNVRETERQLMEVIPKNWWSKGHHLLIYHGRNVCSARNPKCSTCEILELCRYEHKIIKG